MCGIVGVLGERGASAEASAANMAAAISHRGPDDSGGWADHSAGIAFGHARLAVLDLSPAGHQPMLSLNGRWVIAYNGEVYNAGEISSDPALRGITFRGTSDTEVILEAVSAWGVESAVNRLIGMFALAVWDRQQMELYLIRDRIGIKPLYWGHFDGLFLFASELKALRAHPDCRSAINRNALPNFLRHNYIPGPQTIYENIYKLDPGSILKIKPGHAPEISKYWSLSDTAYHNERNFQGDDAEAVSSLENLLLDAVGRRMVADVPLGAFLSGGIDSSTVVALMQSQSSKPVNTFSIGFTEDGFNEAHHAARIAGYLGTQHTELYLSPQDAIDVIPKLPDMFDEPFADSSQIPTYLVAAMTRQHVTVALSGDGGDECFAGYTRYFLAERIRKIQKLFPRFARRFLASGIRSIPPGNYDAIARMLPDSSRPTQFGHRLHKLADILLEEEDDFYRRLISHWVEPEKIVTKGMEQKGVIWDTSIRESIPDFVDRMRYYDMMTYLPDDILTKVDRTSMAVSLEARVPLLDHRVVEFSWRLPMKFKIRNGEGKWLLRQVLYKYVPKTLMDRPKMGFGIPIDHWLRGPLRDWAEDLLDEGKIRQAGYLNPEPIRRKWNEHLAGKHNWQYLLWDVLMFQAWLDRWG